MKILQILDERFNTQRVEISKEANNRFDEIEQIKNCLEVYNIYIVFIE